MVFENHDRRIMNGRNGSSGNVWVAGPFGTTGSSSNLVFNGRSFYQGRPNSSSSSPDRSNQGPSRHHTIRRSQSATMSMNETNNMSRFQDLSIRSVPPDSEDEYDDDNDSLLANPSPTTPTRGLPVRSFQPDQRMPPPIPAPTRQPPISPPLRQQYGDVYADFGRGRKERRHSPADSPYESPIPPPSQSSSSHSQEEYTFDHQFSKPPRPRHRLYLQSSSSIPTIASLSSPTPNSSSPPPLPHSPVLPSSSGSSNHTPSKSQSSSKSSKLSSRQKMLRQPASNSTLQVAAREGSSSSSTPNGHSDAGKVLSLMKELRGRMESVLEFRVGDSLVWTKGFCAINEDTGHLVLVRDDNTQQSIIGDLRGCQIRTPGSSGDEFEGLIEVSTYSSKQDVKLRPLTKHHYDCWLAALLCWQPIRPAGMNNKAVKSQALRLVERKSDRRRNSDASSIKDAAIIKVGKMLMWDRMGQSGSSGGNSLSSKDGQSGSKSSRKSPAVGWRKISCILQENGEFKLYNEQDVALLSIIQLSSLSRCAIQQLDPSVLGMEHCIAIYPQYTPASSFSTLYPQNPIYLAVDSRILYEVWFVLLRAYTVPELYGPAGTASQATSPRSMPEDRADYISSNLCDTFRVPRSFTVRIVEAKLAPPGGGSGSDGHHHHHHHHSHEKKDQELFVEIFVDGEVRARTQTRQKVLNPLWMEQFEFHELPAQLDTVEIVVKQRSTKKKDKHPPGNGNGVLAGQTGWAGEVIGKVEIQMKDLKFDTETETWWSLVNPNRNPDERVGEIMLKLRKEELVVLMTEEYRPLMDVLQNFPNCLTVEIGQVVSTDLRRLAHTLLKIFQVSGKATEWLMALAEAEIDGIHKESSIIKNRFKERVDSNDSQEHHIAADSDNARRDLNKAALTEANILFRGNSLLTKALEAHMKRFGQEYMEETLGGHVKRIAEEDIYCEVDPMKLKSGDDMRQQWKLLLGLTRGLWNSIYTSAAKCPLEIRKVLYHIRCCVEDRYGDFLRAVSYSSVSGFLFLRFFCAAVLNPKLFGLVKDHPTPQAQRTFTLIAKSLQGLANMTTFGVKEPWMEPMNEFLLDHTAEFKEFINAVSTVHSSQFTNNNVPPSYATPITILARLPQAAKEGFPSLPFLIDQPRAMARLVTMWLKWHEVQSERGYIELNGDLLRFHEICMYLKDRMTSCVERAENAERPSSSLSTKWEEVAESVTGSPLFSPGSQHPTLQAFGRSVQPPQPPVRTSRNGSATSNEDDLDMYYPMPGTSMTLITSAHMSAAGRSKLSGFVGGIKRKVRRGAQDME